MDYFRTVKAKAKICLILFVSGAVLCMALDIIGIASVSTESVIHSPIQCSLPTGVVLPLVYIVLGSVIGLLSKRSSDAAIYGASLGQCQSLLPLVLFLFVFHSYDYFELIWRICCGLPLTTAFAGIAFNLKMLIKKNKS